MVTKNDKITSGSDIFQLNRVPMIESVFVGFVSKGYPVLRKLKSDVRGRGLEGLKTRLGYSRLSPVLVVLIESVFIGFVSKGYPVLRKLNCDVRGGGLEGLKTRLLCFETVGYYLSGVSVEQCITNPGTATSA